MAYRFKASDASVKKSVRRIAVGEIRSALAEIDDPDLPPDETVHQVRKRCKRLRALIRLVQPVFRSDSDENAIIRDAAAGLSTARDAAILIQAYDGLKRGFAECLSPHIWAAMRQCLNQRQNNAAPAAQLDEKLKAFRRIMAETGERAEKWKIKKDGFEALAGGLGRTYERGRQAMAAANAEPTVENLHEWRKRAKDHWYHMRLLEPMWPRALKARRKAAGELGELLGDHHDLEVLRAVVAGRPDLFGSARDLKKLFGVMDRRSAILERDAFRLGGRLYAQRTRDFLRTWRVYWDVWKASRCPE